MPKPRSFERLALNYLDLVNAADSLQAAAVALGVDRRTLHRWIRSGKLPRPAHWRRLEAVQPGAAPEPADDSSARRPGERLDDWARRTLSLSGPEWDLLRQAQLAADLADDAAQAPMVRLNASARFQSIVRQLKFPAED